MSAPLNGRCDHCGGNIEFDAPDAGAIAACPLCGRDTVLQPASAVGEDAVAAGEGASPSPKSKRALLFAGIAVVLLALAGTATAIFIKRKNGSGASADSAASRSSSSKSVAPNAADDPPKDVTPVVEKLQGGLSGRTIQAGREVFLSSCTECHRLYDPAFYSATAWANTLGSMRGKAKLSGKQYDDLQTFVRTLRSP